MPSAEHEPINGGLGRRPKPRGSQGAEHSAPGGSQEVNLPEAESLLSVFIQKGPKLRI